MTSLGKLLTRRKMKPLTRNILMMREAYGKIGAKKQTNAQNARMKARARCRTYLSRLAELARSKIVSVLFRREPEKAPRTTDVRCHVLLNGNVAETVRFRQQLPFAPFRELCVAVVGSSSFPHACGYRMQLGIEGFRGAVVELPGKVWLSWSNLLKRTSMITLPDHVGTGTVCVGARNHRCLFTPSVQRVKLRENTDRRYLPPSNTVGCTSRMRHMLAYLGMICTSSPYSSAPTVSLTE